MPERDMNMLSDRDMVLDMLTHQKHLCHIYNQSTLEASQHSVRDILQHIWRDEQHVAYRLYQAMKQHGWYQASTTAGNVHLQSPAPATEPSISAPANKVIPQAGNRRSRTRIHTVEAALQKSAERERRIYDTPPWDLM